MKDGWERWDRRKRDTLKRERKRTREERGEREERGWGVY